MIKEEGTLGALWMVCGDLAGSDLRPRKEPSIARCIRESPGCSGTSAIAATAPSDGWSLRDSQLTTADRLDRLILILALAYLLLRGIGLIARQLFKPSAWNAASRDQCSLFLIGLIMLAKVPASPTRAFNAVLELAEQVVGKWG